MATHDTPKSSLNQHHTTRPASTYPLPKLRRPIRIHSCTTHYQGHRVVSSRKTDYIIIPSTAKKILSQNRTHFPQNPSHANHTILDRKSTRLNSSHSQISYAV